MGRESEILHVTGKRILVVGINYAPEPAGIAPYTAALASSLVRAGNEVLVLAGPPSYPAWRIAEGYRGRAVVREHRAGAEVWRLWHYVPHRMSGLHRAIYELTFGIHVYLQRLPWHADHVVAVIPSLLGAAAAALLARRHRASLTVWVQDLIGGAVEQSGMTAAAVIGKTARTAECAVVRRADRICVVSERFSRYLTDLGADPASIDVVPNWPHISAPHRSRSEIRQMLGWSNTTAVALHTGNMGYKQALENIVDAARMADSVGSNVLFVLMGDGSQRATITAYAANVHRLNICGFVAEDLYPDVIAAADVLLVNERPTVLDMSLPSKLTSYMLAKRPIVAAVNQEGATAQEVRLLKGGNLVPPMNSKALLDAVIDAAAMSPSDKEAQ